MESNLSTIVLAEREVQTDSRYYYNNAKRKPTNLCVIQRTLSGQGYIIANEEKSIVSKDKTMLFRYGEASEYGYDTDVSTPYSLEYITFFGGAAETTFRDILKNNTHIISTPPQSEIVTLMTSILHRHQNQLFRDRYEVSGMLYELVLAMLRSMTDTQETTPIVRAREKIQSHYMRPFNIKELANEVGISREHLTREYTKEYGESPAAALERLRLSHARALLQSSTLMLDEIARRTGYLESNSLRRAYLRYFGVTPSKNRN